jgi:cytochrome c oxidase assembly protein subunit 15
LLALEAIQALIGIIQSRSGLPIVLVGSHMIIACGIAAMMTVVVLSLRSTSAQQDESITPDAALATR